MKKPIALSIAAIFIAATLAGCMPASETTSAISANIRITSSDAESAAVWLSARLGDALTEKVMIGTDADRYGVDVSSFENDGYIIRCLGGEIAILARTTDGLDRAVRYYAKHFDDGDIETVYGDGQPRVGKIILAGYDISEYVILIPSDATECVRFSAENVRDYTKKACGAELPITTERSAHNIEFIEDESVHDQGFVIETTDGQMTMRHGFSSGALNGAMTFLEKYEGWRFLYTATNYYRGEGGAIDYIYAADTVEIPAGISHAEEPAIIHRGPYGGLIPDAAGCFGYKIKFNGEGTAANHPEYGNYHRHSPACHGISDRFHEYGHYKTLDELESIAGNYPICFSDEYNIELIETAVLEYIEKRLAQGWRIGMELSCIDIANYDTSWYCECKTCTALRTAEGSNSALILNYANPIAKTVAEKYGDDLYVSILAYFGSSKPPRTMVPEKNVHVSYCFYVDPGMTAAGSACGAHPFSGDGCEPGKFNDACSKEFEKWCEIATCVDIWEYGDDYHPTAISNPFTLALDNIRYIADCGAYGSCWLGTNALNVALSQYLVIRELWDPYITHDEMWDTVREYCRIVYGEDCGDYVTEIYRIFDDAARLVPCYFMLRAGKASDKYNTEYCLENSGTMFALFDRAIESAPTSALETQIKYMRCYFENAIVCALWDEYSAGSEEQKAYLAEHYHIFYDCARESGWNGNSWERRDKDYSFPAFEKMDFTIRPDYYVGD